jgi:hypothetical protein
MSPVRSVTYVSSRAPFYISGLRRLFYSAPPADGVFQQRNGHRVVGVRVEIERFGHDGISNPTNMSTSTPALSGLHMAEWWQLVQAAVGDAFR